MKLRKAFLLHLAGPASILLENISKKAVGAEGGGGGGGGGSPPFKL